MKRYTNSIYRFPTVNNSHEEDDEVFEPYEASAADRVLTAVATVAVASMLMLMCV